MNRDLEEQLNEMGPAYRAVVDRLLGETAAPRAEVRHRGVPGWAYLAAASLLLLVGLGVLFQTTPTIPTAQTFQTPQTFQTSSCGAREYRMSIDEMIATQNPDGGWRNDFLTRHNAEALKACSTPEARIAYKRAMRNLRLKGAL